MIFCDLVALEGCVHTLACCARSGSVVRRARFLEMTLFLAALATTYISTARSPAARSRGLVPRLTFADLDVPADEMQQMLRRDVGRRCTELTLLGWLGRAYLLVPVVFDRWLPTVFELTAYDASGAACYEVPGSIDCTLKEGSVGGVKGIPFHLRLLTANDGSITGAELLGIGCDLTSEAATGSGERAGRMGVDEVRNLCERLGADAEAKQLVVRAITRAVFGPIAAAAAAVEQSRPLEACGAELRFEPRKETWGLEGTSEKWLQRVSGYYFAASRLQNVRFEPTAPSSAADELQFTFYLDPKEPINSEDPTRIVNPEVVRCTFSCGVVEDEVAVG